MTKKEFDLFISGLKKKPGEYTQEEVMDIGIKHTELIEGKDWPELARMLGVAESGEQLRKKVLRERYKRGLVKKNPKVLDDKTVDTISLEDTSNLLTQQREELFKQQQKTRDERTAYRKLLRTDARIDSLKDTIKETVAQLKELPEVSGEIKNEGTNEAVLMLSDLHIGVDCNNFYNVYNVDVAAKRLGMLALKTIKYCKAHDVRKLSVCNLGDCIHGLIHITARLEQQCDTVEQVMIASELIASFLNYLVVNSNLDIVYRSCSDNHSRVVADKNQAIETDNFGRIIDWFLHERLKNTRITFANDNLDYGIGKFKVFNKNIVFVHGHNDSIDKMMQNMIGATGEIIDYALMGHFHSEKMKSYQGFKVFVNGSIVGTEEYALSKRLFSKPSQTLLVFNNQDDDVVNISVNLEDR